ncbi:MAG: radical SAM protein [Bacillota bacterium]|jgi:MoaA/NifB/PqqE/SkfB family radical SAM enzyme|nr:radical SAM protein [Bacillota bacterium]
MASGLLGQLQLQTIKTALKYMEKDPEKNLPKLVQWADKIDKTGYFKKYRDHFRRWTSDPDNNWNKYMMSLWSDIDDGVRMKFFENFMLNACFKGMQRQKANRDKYNCNIPWAILMDPTSACNLKCTGCWAAEYGNKLNMTFDELDSIITQGKELGTFMYIYSGGEPLVRKDDVIKLCEKHSDCMFLAFTNATLIDEKFADEMLRVKNFMPAISIEGFEEATDFRRGEGTYKKVVRAMEILKERKLAFGISCCYTSKNAEVIGSEEYIDDMIAKGAKFAWFFTYMPIGNDAVTDLIATAEQREYMYHQIRKFRKTKPLFTMDFWNDGEFVHGCIAGGRNYLHINANGDIEPCAFVHYSDSNIREKTLLEAYMSPMFMQYHDNQPFNDNMLRPCPVLDNAGKLAEMVHACGAHSTDLQSPEDVDDYCERCRPTAEAWAITADRLWKEEVHE